MSKKRCQKHGCRRKKCKQKSEYQRCDPYGKRAAARKGDETFDISQADSAVADPRKEKQKQYAAGLFQCIKKKRSETVLHRKICGRKAYHKEQENHAGNSAKKRHFGENFSFSEIGYGVDAKLQNPGCGSCCIQEFRYSQIF